MLCCGVVLCCVVGVGGGSGDAAAGDDLLCVVVVGVVPRMSLFLFALVCSNTRLWYESPVVTNQTR